MPGHDSRALLANTRLVEFLGSSDFSLHPDNVRVLQTNCTVAAALQELAAYNLSSAPVVDSYTEEYVGILDSLDILSGLVRASYPELLEQSFLQHKTRLSIQELQTLGVEFMSQTISDLLHGGDLWYKGDKQSTLEEVVVSGFRVGKVHQAGIPGHSARTHHRITVFDILPGEQTPDGPVPQWRISTVISQADVVRWLATKAPSGDAALDATIASLELAAKPVTCVSASTPTLSAFALMHKERLWGVGVTDNKGALISNLSINDLRGLTSDQFGSLALPVGTFLLLKRGKVVWEDVLVDQLPAAIKNEDWAEVLQVLPVITAAPDTTLRDVAMQMVDQKVHRVYVRNQDDGGKAAGVVTHTDILRLVSAVTE